MWESRTSPGLLQKARTNRFGPFLCLRSIFGTSAMQGPPSDSFDDRLQFVLMQAQVGDQLLQPRILITELLGLLRLAYLHAAIRRLPWVPGVPADATSRPTSSAFRPSTNCFSAATICASVCLLYEIPPSPFPCRIIEDSVRLWGVRSEHVQ
jgi:hypothetical protein